MRDKIYGTIGILFGIPMVFAVILVPPAVLCFYMGWPFYIYETVAGLWFIIMISWGIAISYASGKLENSDR